MNPLAHLRDEDPEIYESIRSEMLRQEYGLELIASENFVGRALLEAVGSVMTNKYAEGRPGRRYYGGCEQVDVAENLARDRARELFGAGYAGVQPHSGSQANMAVYLHAIDIGDKILAMSLDAGGHLTHGSPVNFSGRFYDVVPYGVDKESEQIDYDEVARLAEQHKPKLVVAGATAYSRTIDFQKFADIANSVGARLMVDMSHISGLIAAGVHPSPVPMSDYVTSTTHKTLRGPRGGMILGKEEYGKGLDASIFPRIQGGPLMHVIAAKAVAYKQAMTDEFKTYQRQIVANARALADALVGKGLRIVSGGTDNHLFTIDLRPKSLTGNIGELALEKAHITVNKNQIPFDPEKPMVTSGLRLGTPALTTRGMKEGEMEEVATLIDRVLAAPEDDANLARVREDVQTLAKRFPLYQDLIDHTPEL